jgi:hypothetical protein
MSNKEIGDFCLIPREDLILIPEITDLRNAEKVISHLRV